MSLLGREEKERILRSLEEDREFRYALMGLLGYKELLDRFARLEERQQRLEERFAELEERFARLEERVIKLEERVTRLEERFAQLEERFAQLEERVARLEERFAQLEERFLRLEERVTRLEEQFLRLEERVTSLEREVKRLGATVGALGNRMGRRFEALVREGYKDLFDRLGIDELKVERFRYIDVEGKYLEKGTIIEVDIIIRDGVLWILEVKSNVEIDDVEWFSVKARVVEEVLGRKANRKLILAIITDRDTVKRANNLGIDTIYITLAD